MLNEEKIRLMTELAVLEKKNVAQLKQASGYFKSDFISRFLIRNFVSYTICCTVLFCIWVVFHMDLFLSTIEIEQLIRLSRGGILLYAAGLVLYLLLTWWIYGKRYATASRVNRIYVAKLKHLDKRYEYHSRSRELAREGRSV